jgi:ribosomal protein L37E
MDDNFKETVDGVLHDLGLTFKGIHLQCRNCGEEAFATASELAEMFGWSDIQQVKGAEYHGICMTCGSSPHKKGASS